MEGIQADERTEATKHNACQCERYAGLPEWVKNDIISKIMGKYA